MAAANFYTKNANAYYVILGDETCREDWQFNEILNDISEFIISKYGYETASGSDCRARYYEARNLAEKSEFHSLTKNWLTDFRVTKILQVRSGYYSGANLDYDITIELDGSYTGEINVSEYSDDDDAINDQIDGLIDYVAAHGCESWNAGTVKMLRPMLFKKMQKIINEARAELEQICAESCEATFVCSACFSNGEAWYKKVS